MLRPARVENHPSDKGCRLSPSCLECLEPVCKDERPGYYERERRRLTPRVVEIRDSEHRSWREISAMVGITSPTARKWYILAQEEKVGRN